MEKKNFTKKSKRVSALALATAMMMSFGVPAMAAGSNYSGTIEGTKTATFDKYLVMDQQANVPNASFTYTVTPGQAKAYDLNGKTFEVFAGVNADAVTMAGVGTTDAKKITYKPGDTTAQDENALIKNYDNTVEKYALKTATLDFSACQFTEPGVYRYVLTETADPVNQAITNDGDTTRIIDVYVNDASDATTKKLTIAGYVLHSNADDNPDLGMGNDNGTGGSYPNTKSQGFTNDYDTSDLTFRKEVSGNQASHDKYFEFTLNIEDAVVGTVYDVDITGADATSGSNVSTIAANSGQTNPTQLTIGSSGNLTQKFYLQHGQEIKIQGIAKDSTYEVLENEEDYKSTAAGVTGYADATNGTVVSTDLKTSYLNTRDGVIPTGVIMTIAPFAAVTLLGGFGAATIAMKKKKREDDEE